MVGRGRVGNQLVLIQVKCKSFIWWNLPDVDSRAPSLLARYRGWGEVGRELGLQERVGQGNFI